LTKETRIYIISVRRGFFVTLREKFTALLERLLLLYNFITGGGVGID
jgi:hypothetical protein